MYPFWDLVVEPAVRAAGAQRVVEIGALRGDTTTRMLEGLGPSAELHVIDPVPVFDPTEHEQRFEGRYVFHRDLSLNVLPDLPPFDAALVDGDHNWYTVVNELRLLAATAREAGRGLPLLVVHDVGFPYGRRDLYYAPEQIPEDARQPYARQGIRRGQSDLLPDGGVNPTNCNAVHEGGPRNGVMTALEDFLAEHDRPYRLVVLPLYYGLAIVAEEALLERRPELSDVLDRVESRDGQAELVALAEELRLDAVASEQGAFFAAKSRIEASARRYLDILKGALLNEHYLEQELRIHQLVRAIERGNEPFGESLRDPTRRLIAESADLRARRRAGRVGEGDDPRDYFPFTAMGRVRLDDLERRLDIVREEAVVGDLVEVGTGRGGGAVLLRGYLEAYRMSWSRVFVADEFRVAPPGRSTTDPPPEGTSLPAGGPGFPDLLADLTAVREAFDRFDLLDHRVRFLQGPYGATLPTAETEKIALLRIGDTGGADVGAVLDALYDRVTVGGFVVVDRYADPACAKGVDEFRARRDIAEPLERVDASAVSWRKLSAVTPTAGERPSEQEVEPARPPVPLQGALWIGQLDLTVVVVFYNMQREAARTLHSLSRSYQQGIDDLEYEVVVVENGSDPDQRLTQKYVTSFGPEFRFLDLGDEATPSPAAALNRGIAMGRGNAFALMIDGAHVLTPGVLRYGMAGLHTYEPAVVATQQWFVGPGEQSEAIAEGYDSGVEDVLFDRIRWPESGYRLFDIGHFIGERDWLDGMWESNCLFVPRSLLEQSGCFDERFDVPGGGYANLDFYERMTLAPDVTLVSVLGEGSFHQVHGGATTNLPDPEARHREMTRLADQYEELRGKRFFGHNKQMHYVGAIRPEAARTRALRRVVPNLFAGTEQGGVPTQARPMPRDLADAFFESYWESLAWQRTQWLGRAAGQPPADLVAYQDLVVRVRPEWIVETGTGTGTRALFLASICDLVGSGRVLSIGPHTGDDRPEHPRITYLPGSAEDEEVLGRVRELVGDPPRALVILGSRVSAGRTFAEFRALESLVPVGSYVVIADTVVGGHPVWDNFGPGPYEAVRGVAETRDDFVVDRAMDGYTPGFNKGGYLKRVG